MEQTIELRKQRDFGQIINDSFTFLKQNFKPLFRTLFIICGFLILIGIISSIFYYYNIGSSFNININSPEARSKPLMVIITAFLTAFTVLLAQAFIQLTTICYISVYLQKTGKTPSLAEVWGYFKYFLLRALGSSIVTITLFFIGCIFCLIPGIYLLPIFSLIIPIIVIENTSFGYAFSASFRLIKNNWWLVFGVIFVMGFMVWIAHVIVDIPLTFITLGDKFLPVLNGIKLPIVIVSSIIKNVLSFAYVIPTIAIALCYFSLSEEKDSTGLMDRIDKLGKAEDNQPQFPAEEF